MRMKLWAGRSSNSGTEVIFPIYDLLPSKYTIPAANHLNWSYTVTTPQSQVVSFESLYIFATDATSLYMLFPADIPKKSTDEGNIIMLNGAMVEDSTAGTYIIPDSDFTPISGTEPDNWRTARYKYYFCYNNDSIPTYRRYSNVRTNATTLTDQVSPFTGAPTVFDPSVTYYYNNSQDPRNDICQLYTAATGSSFGILRNYDAFGDSYVTIGGVFTENNDTYYNQSYGYNTPFWYSPFGINPSTVYPPNYVKMLYNVDYATGGLPLTNTKAITIFVSYEYNGKMFYGMAMVTMSDRTDSARPIAVQAQLFSEEYWGESIISGGSSGGEWGPSSVIDGGNGSFSATSDPHGTGDADDVQTELSTTISALTNVFGGNGGFNIHEILPAAISDVLSVLYSTNFLTRYAQAMYDPMSAILSMHLIPSNLIKFKQTSSKITASGYDISANMPSGAATTIFPEVMPETVYHVGTIDIGNFFGAFPDYAPYTECILHLPYIGTIKIDTNAIMYGKLAVYYACDAATGNVCAWVWCRDRDENRRNYKYMATGNAAYTIPVAARNNNGLDAGKLLGNVASAVFMGAMGNTLGAGLSAIRAGFQANPFLMPKSTIVEGTFGGNASTLENSMCFLEIIRPEWVQPESYPDDMGIPTFITGTIAELGAAGYIEIEEIDIENLAATDTEKEELRKILYDGFWYIPAE